MTTETLQPVAAKGGDFLIEDRTPGEVFTPEDYTDEQNMLAQTARDFMQKAVLPKTPQILKLDYEVIRQSMREAGEIGLLGIEVPEEYGGLALGKVTGALASEISAMEGSWAVTFMGHTGIGTLPITYFGTDEQKAKYLPGMVSGDVITAIAMTEPGTGSDLQGLRTTARKDGNHYVINGSKTYITNGQNADLILVCCKTDTEVKPAWKGVSVILVEASRDGFKRGRNLDKVGLDAADTSELFFEDVRVPITNCLGEEGKGFIYLMSELPQERLSIAIGAQTAAQRSFDQTVEFVRERKAFGKPILDFQNTRFVLADLKTKLQVGWAHIDWALARHMKKELTPEEASAAKLWHTELQGEVVDKCLQLHGGAGFMNEYPIAKQFRGARVTRIFGGTSEIMKELIGRKL